MNAPRPRQFVVLYSLGLIFVLMAPTVLGADTNRAWAARVQQAGLPNLHRVTTNIYRSAQPTTAGLRAAEKLGVKTVINLRAFHSDSREAKSTKLKTEHIHFNTWHPEEEDVLKFLKIVTDTNAGPFLVHCLHGADRTGTMIAIYRMTVEGWSKDEAIKEMTTGDFGYHTVWKNLIRYLKALDVEDLRKKAGVKFTAAE